MWSSSVRGWGATLAALLASVATARAASSQFYEQSFDSISTDVRWSFDRTFDVVTYACGRPPCAYAHNGAAHSVTRLARWLAGGARPRRPSQGDRARERVRRMGRLCLFSHSDDGRLGLRHCGARRQRCLDRYGPDRGPRMRAHPPARVDMHGRLTVTTDTGRDRPRPQESVYRPPVLDTDEGGTDDIYGAVASVCGQRGGHRRGRRHRRPRRGDARPLVTMTGRYSPSSARNPIRRGRVATGQRLDSGGLEFTFSRKCVTGDVVRT